MQAQAEVHGLWGDAGAVSADAITYEFGNIVEEHSRFVGALARVAGVGEATQEVVDLIVGLEGDGLCARGAGAGQPVTRLESLPAPHVFEEAGFEGGAEARGTAVLGAAGREPARGVGRVGELASVAGEVGRACPLAPRATHAARAC